MRKYKTRSDAKTDPSKWREAHDAHDSSGSTLPQSSAAPPGKQLNRPPSPGWSAGLFPIATPELVKAPEESLFLARKYVRGLFSVGLWRKDQDVTLYEEKWTGIIGCKYVPRLGGFGTVDQDAAAAHASELMRSVFLHQGIASSTWAGT